MFRLETADGMSIKSLQAFPFCEMASFLFLGKGGAQPVVWSTLVHCPTVALKTNWVKIHWCRVFQSVPTRGENKCDKWARLNLHSRLITLQKQMARRTVLMAMDGETETGNAVEMGLASKSTHIPFPLSCMNPPQSWAVSGLFGGRQQSKPRYGRKWQNTMQDNFVSDLDKKKLSDSCSKQGRGYWLAILHSQDTRNAPKIAWLTHFE